MFLCWKRHLIKENVVKRKSFQALYAAGIHTKKVNFLNTMFVLAFKAYPPQLSFTDVETSIWFYVRLKYWSIEVFFASFRGEEKWFLSEHQFLL